MSAYIVKRVAALVLNVFLVTIFVFVMLRILSRGPQTKAELAKEKDAQSMALRSIHPSLPPSTIVEDEAKETPGT